MAESGKRPLGTVGYSADVLGFSSSVFVLLRDLIQTNAGIYFADDKRDLLADTRGIAMTEYLITFNDEWVPEHTEEQLGEKAAAARAVIDEMLADGVLIFTQGGLDASTAVCSVEAVDGKPVFIDGPYVETKEHLGGFAVERSHRKTQRDRPG